MFNWKTYFTFLLVITLHLISAGAIASDELKVTDVLDKMSKALREKTYQGRFMYVVGNEISSFQIQHTVYDGKEYERLVFLNQKDQEVVRVGHELFCIHKGNHLLRENHSLSSNPVSQRFQGLNETVFPYYEIGISQDQMVAGRDVYHLKFIAKDNNRYNHHLWVDRSNFLLLKSNISDSELGVLESFEFSHIEVGGNIAKSEFEHEEYIRHQASHIEPHSEVNQQQNNWQVGWVPDGFVLSGVKKQQIESENQQRDMQVIMYTDGLSAVSLFIEAVNKPSAFSESSQNGALSAYSQSMKALGQGFMITAVGEVQLHTLERIVKSVNFQAQQTP